MGSGAGLGVGSTVTDVLGVGSTVTDGEVGLVGVTTSGSTVMESVVETTVVSIVSSTRLTLATGTFTPEILASLVSNTLIFVPEFTDVPANLTPVSYTHLTLPTKA